MTPSPASDDPKQRVRHDIVLAHLAIEYWKLLRSFEKMSDVIPEESKMRLISQARYAAGRLEALLSDAKMRLVDFDGLPFELNLPAMAINGEDVVGLVGLLVERTIQPAILADQNVIIMGKVFVAQRGDGHVPGD